MKGVRKPSESEKRFLRKLQGDMEKCPFCNADLPKFTVIRRKSGKACRCKKCGEMVSGNIVW